MEHSPRAPFRITEAELHQWFEAATRPSRATTMFHLIESLGRPMRAAELVRRCARFRQAWQDHRHLLRPLAAYCAPERANGAGNARGAREGPGLLARSAAAVGAAVISSSRPAGAQGQPGTPAGRPWEWEVEWTFTRFPDGRILLEVPDA